MKHQSYKLLAGLAFAALLMGCKKEFNYAKTGSSHIAVFHTVPNARGVNILANDQPFIERLGYLGSSPGLYKAVPNGPVNVTIYDTTRRANIFSGAINVEANTNYSVFAYDTVKAGAVQALVLKDDLTTPTTGVANVRFLHLSPNAPGVDVWALWSTLPGGTPLTDSVRLFQNVLYVGNTTPNAELSRFSPVPAGRYVLRVRVASSGQQVLNIPNVDLGGQKCLTVVARGLVGSTATPLGASIYINN